MFTVCAPSYTDKSAGVWMLHFLCHSLNELGYPATLAAYTHPFQSNSAWATGPEHREDNIVVYPEVVADNPFSARRVVRYLLNREGAGNGRRIAWGADDFPLSFSSVYRADCATLFYPVTDLSLFHPGDGETPRMLGCWYRGKGSGPDGEGVEITRRWPASKRELADLLRRCRVMRCLDPCTALSLDAALCGCVPWIVGAEPPVGELGRFWATDAGPVDREAFEGLRERVAGLQASWLERLDAVVSLIRARWLNGG